MRSERTRRCDAQGEDEADADGSSPGPAGGAARPPAGTTRNGGYGVHCHCSGGGDRVRGARRLRLWHAVRYAAPEWSTPVQDTAAPAPRRPNRAPIGDSGAARSTNWSRCGWRRHRATPSRSSVGAADQRARQQCCWCPPGRCPCRPTKPDLPQAATEDDSRGRQLGMRAPTLRSFRPGRRGRRTMQPVLHPRPTARAALSSRSLPSCQHPLQPVVRCSCSMSQTLRAVRPPQCTSSASSGRQGSRSRRGRCRSRSAPTASVTSSLTIAMRRKPCAPVLRVSCRAAPPVGHGFLVLRTETAGGPSRGLAALLSALSANRRHQRRQLPDNAGGGAERGVPEEECARSSGSLAPGPRQACPCRWQTGAQRAV